MGSELTPSDMLKLRDLLIEHAGEVPVTLCLRLPDRLVRIAPGGAVQGALRPRAWCRRSKGCSAAAPSASATPLRRARAGDGAWRRKTGSGKPRAAPARFFREYTAGLRRSDLRRLFDREAAEAYAVLTRDQPAGEEPKGG